MKLKCFESTDSNGTEQYLIPLQDGSFVAVPKERIKHIVRCKECGHWEMRNSPRGWCVVHQGYVSPQYFCADGERKESE